MPDFAARSKGNGAAVMIFWKPGKMAIRPYGIGNALAVIAIVAIGLIARTGLAREVTVIDLTQTPCQFLESENGVNRGYTSLKKSDCDTINSKTGPGRLAKAKILELKPGRYLFRITNKNVPYPLGFWLRGDGLINRAMLPSVSGGGITLGSIKEYSIELKEGEYVYSCPLNPTPNYKLIVR